MRILTRPRLACPRCRGTIVEPDAPPYTHSCCLCGEHFGSVPVPDLYTDADVRQMRAARARQLALGEAG